MEDTVTRLASDYEAMKRWAEAHPEQYEEMVLRVMLEKHLETGPVSADLVLKARQIRVLERIATVLERLPGLNEPLR